MPKPKKERGSSWKDFNKRIIEEGVEAAVDNGLVHIKDYKKMKESLQLYQLNTKSLGDRDKLENLWIHGKSGAGKSHYVRENHPGFYDKPLNKWWDGYKDQKVVLIDDLEEQHGKWIGFFLKRWADHYSFPAETKGGTT